MTDETTKRRESIKKLPELVAALPGRIFRRDALGLVIALCLGAAAYRYLQTEVTKCVEKGVDDGVKPINERIRYLAGIAEEEKVKLQAATFQLQADVVEIRRTNALKEERDAERFWVLYKRLTPGEASLAAKELGQPRKDDGK